MNHPGPDLNDYQVPDDFLDMEEDEPEYLPMPPSPVKQTVPELAPPSVDAPPEDQYQASPEDIFILPEELEDGKIVHAKQKVHSVLTAELLLDLYEDDTFVQVATGDLDDPYEKVYIGSKPKDRCLETEALLEYPYQGLKKLYQSLKTLDISDPTKNMDNLDILLNRFEDWQLQLFPFKIPPQTFARKAESLLKIEPAEACLWTLRQAHLQGWEAYHACAKPPVQPQVSESFMHLL